MILDTDVLIDLERKHAPALAWFAGLPGPPSAAGNFQCEALQCYPRPYDRATVYAIRLPHLRLTVSSALALLRDITRPKFYAALAVRPVNTPNDAIRAAIVSGNF